MSIENQGYTTPEENSEIKEGGNEIKIEGKLSPEEEKKVITFLQERKEEEKNLVVIITKDEIQNLRNSLKEEPPKTTTENTDNNSETKSLKEFLEAQDSEITTSSEIFKGNILEEKLQGNEKLKTVLNFGDEISHKLFFDGEKGLFKGLNISEDAKRNFSTGTTLYMMEYLNNILTSDKKYASLLNELLSIKNPSEIIKGDKIKKLEKISEILYNSEGFKTLKNLDIKSINEALKSDDSGKEAGENYGIFMNPNQSFNLLKGIFEENKKESDIIKSINDSKGQNLKISSEEINNLAKVGDKLNSLISPEAGKNAADMIGNLKKSLNNGINGIKKAILGNETALGVLSMLKKVPWLGKIIEAFLGFLGIKNIDEILSGKDFENGKKSISESITKKGSIFALKTIPENFMKNSSGKDDTVFLSNIKYLTGNKEGKDFSKNIELLFSTNNGKFKTFHNTVKDIKKFKIGKLEDGDTINYNNLAKTVDLYKEYIIENNKKPLKPEDFIKNKEKNIKKSENIIELEKEKVRSNTTDVKSITENEKFEISEHVEYVFEHNKVKYKTILDKDGTLMITGGNKQVEFSGAKEIFNYIESFKNKLDKKANGTDFGKADVELNGYTIKELLLNGMNEELNLSGLESLFATDEDKKVNKKGLKDQITSNLLSNNGLKDSDVTIEFNDKSFVLTKQASKGFKPLDPTEKEIKDKKNKELDIANEKEKNAPKLENGTFRMQKLEISDNGKKAKFNGEEYEINKIGKIDWFSNYDTAIYENSSKGFNLEVDGKIFDLVKFYDENLKQLQTSPNTISLNEKFEFEKVS